MPLHWKEGYLIKLPKKGDLSNCTNYRGITLLDVSGKVFNRALLNRMKDEIDTKFRDQQAGFCKYRSCVDQIATLRIIIEQSCEWNSPVYQFCRFRKSIRQCGQRYTLEASPTLWGASKDCKHHSIFI